MNVTKQVRSQAGRQVKNGVTALLLLAAMLVSQGAAAEEWTHSRKLSIDTTANGADLKESVAQLPLLVRLHSGNFTFAEAKPDGADLRFFAADGKTPLKFHIESFDAANELAVVWVAMPKLAGNAATDSLLLRWGNPAATPANDAKGTYDAAQLLVLHFTAGDGARETTARPVAAGPIGAAAAFDGVARVVPAPAAPLQLTAAGGFTFTALVNPAAADDGKLYEQRDGAARLSIGLAAGVPSVSFGSASAKALTALKPGVWQHLAVVVAAGKATFYIDGNEAGSAPLAMQDIGGDAVVGETFRGELDEVTLAAAARSHDYVRALATSQMPDTPMLSFDDGAAPEEGISYAKILLGAVTMDGWIVIGILMIMAVVSVWVMISKTMTLARIDKANQAFLERFGNKPVQLLTPGHVETAALAADAQMKRSSIYHLYAIGLREMTHRFTAQTSAGRDNSLSAAALDAIRASLDAAMVRENQRLNSGIVLLTIAISGGPFLGLLGTVVGVMITFAAIAAAGDVNVNAIAPGIAAALVATVAGLAVAIPALFGYNWLAIRIKNVSADTQVFADEFLTKSAELHAI